MITLQERVHGASLPATWTLNKLHHVLKVRKGFRNSGMQEDNLLSLSYGNVIRKDISSSEGLLPESFETYQIVEPGNIVLRLTDLQNDKRSLRQGLVRERGIVTSAYDALQVAKSHDPRFWAYALLALDLAKYYYSLGGGVRQSIKFADFPNDWLRTPDLECQKAIADFLDDETARIDLLIEKKRRFAKLLGARRDADAFEILSGRRANAKRTKQSRLQWMGQTPDDWVELPLKQTARVFDCKHVTPSYVEDGVPLISTGEVKPYKLSFTSQRQVSEADYASMTEGGRAPGENDIVYSRNASVGAAARVGSTGRFCMGQDICLIRPYKIESRLLEHQLNSQVVLQQLEYLLVGSTLKRININNIKNFVLLVPPPEEQPQLIDQLDRSLQYASRHSRLLNSSIERLGELRSALITAAVTGQVDLATWKKHGRTEKHLHHIEEQPLRNTRHEVGGKA